MGAFEFLGYNLRLSDIQSAIGLAQMAKLDGLLAHRRWCAQGYTARLKNLGWLRVPHEPAGSKHSYQSYVVWVRPEAPAPRNDIMEWLEKVAPPGLEYRHHQTGEDNADAHLKRMVLGHQVLVPVTGGKLDLGPWERIHYGEFDGKRPKRVLFKALGV